MTMPKSLAKVQKKVIKKKGKTSSLHENSRDAQKLRRAGAREEKLVKLASMTAKSNRLFTQRIAFFKGAATATTGPVEVEKIQGLVEKYISRYHDELAQIQGERRPGRPPSSQEDALKHKIEVENREYATGYWIPDMQDEDNLSLLQRWGGDWGYLSTLKFVRLAKDGSIRQSCFPPKGQS